MNSMAKNGCPSAPIPCSIDLRDPRNAATGPESGLRDGNGAAAQARPSGESP